MKKNKKLFLNIFIVTLLVFLTTTTIADTKTLSKNYKACKDNTSSLGMNDYHWTYEYLDGSDNPESHVGYWSNIDIDSNGYPHIVYCDFARGGANENPPSHMTGDVRYCYWNGNNWIYETVDTTKVSGLGLSFALDNYDRPHIIYMRDGYSIEWEMKETLCYATKYGDDWQVNIIDDTWLGEWSRFRWDCDLALDNYGNPHVVYSAHVNDQGYQLYGAIIYAKLAGSYWEKEVVAKEMGVFHGTFFTSIDVDYYGDPHIMFDTEDENVEDEINTLSYTTKQGGIWSDIESIVTDVGVHGSIALDYYGQPHIVTEIKKDYSEDFYKEMIYCTKTGGVWNVEKIESDSTYQRGYRESDIVIDSYDIPHVVFHYSDTDQPYYTKCLKYATKLGGFWEIETTIPWGERNYYGNYPKIVLDSYDNPIISAKSEDLNSLMYFAKIASPERPEMPNGEYEGEEGVSYTYTTVAESYLEGDIQYGWDWDGDFIIDEWTPWYEPGDVIASTHSWDISGYYEVRVKARSKNTGQSEWSDPLSISIPRARSIERQNTLLLDYLKFILSSIFY
jgi:hypothetical protein